MGRGRVAPLSSRAPSSASGDARSPNETFRFCWPNLIATSRTLPNGQLSNHWIWTDGLGAVRPIYLAQLDKQRPVLVLTRELIRPHLNTVTVAPITSRIRGIATELPVGPANGLDHESVVNCDSVTTVPTDVLRRQIGWLLPAQELALTEAIGIAFDLE